jgi:Na+-translocating ferredoxin:NAD+ oxidoreductase RnfA subunit
MTPRGLFSVALRLIGVCKLLGASDDLVTAYNVSTGVSRTELLSTASYVNHASVAAILGLLLVFGAPFLASLLVPASVPAQTRP